MKNIEKMIFDNFVNPLIKKEGNTYFIEEEDYQKLELSSKEKEIFNHILNMKNIKIKEEVITKSDRSSRVNDFDYGEKETYGIKDRDLPVFSEIEYNEFGDIIYENDDSLLKYLETEFLPNTVIMKKEKNQLTQEYNYFPSIQLSKIVSLKLSEEENRRVLNYLSEKGIRVCGKNSTLDSEFDNYDYYKNYKSYVLPKTLTKDEMIAKFKLLKEMKDPIIREQLILANMRLVPYIASRYAKEYAVDMHEIEQYGYEGLITAVDKFDYTKGYSFSTYAYSYIKGYILSGMTDINYMHKHELDILKAIMKIEELKEQKISENPKLAEEVVDLLISKGYCSYKNKKENIRRIKLYSAISLDALLEENNDIISNESISSNLSIKELMRNDCNQALNTLKPMHKYVIEQLYGLNGNEAKTIAEVAKLINRKPERVRQIEVQSLRKLRHPSRLEKLQYYLPEDSNINDNIEQLHSIYNYDDDIEELNTSYKER